MATSELAYRNVETFGELYWLKVSIRIRRLKMQQQRYGLVFAF